MYSMGPDASGVISDLRLAHTECAALGATPTPNSHRVCCAGCDTYA
jgi:hypothetical protein